MYVRTYCTLVRRGRRRGRVIIDIEETETGGSIVLFAVQKTFVSQRERERERETLVVGWME